MAEAHTAIEANRQRNQTAGFLGGLFILPYAAPRGRQIFSDGE